MNNPHVPMPIIDVKLIDFFKAVIIRELLFFAAASEIAGSNVVESAVKIEEGNIINGITIPESSPYNAIESFWVKPNSCSFWGINIFSIVDKNEPVILFAVNGIAIAKMVPYTSFIFIVGFEYKFFSRLKCLWEIYTYTNDAISPRHIPVIAAAEANSTPFGINIPERKNIAAILTLCSKTWLIAGVSVSRRPKNQPLIQEAAAINGKQKHINFNDNMARASFRNIIHIFSEKRYIVTLSILAIKEDIIIE